MGDTPPVGFSITVTSAGLIQLALPSIAGFAQASINYSLNAPAVGATFPLSIDAGAITTGTIGSARLPAGQYPGSTSGVAIAAGYVGETLGTLRSGTGGFTYSTRTTTAPTTSFAPLVSTTLNKGVYLVYGNAACALSVAGQLYGYIAIGGTQVSNTISQSSPTGGYDMAIGIAVPITISSDSTSVAFYGRLNVTTGLVVNGHELFAVRIA
jgi:hypothetical protein